MEQGIDFTIELFRPHAFLDRAATKENIIIIRKLARNGNSISRLNG